jgi:hypothetical protein
MEDVMLKDMPLGARIDALTIAVALLTEKLLGGDWRVLISRLEEAATLHAAPVPGDDAAAVQRQAAIVDALRVLRGELTELLRDVPVSTPTPVAAPDSAKG